MLTFYNNPLKPKAMLTNRNLLQHHSDNDLVNLYKEGNECALPEIFKRYKPKIINFIFKLTFYNNPNAEDFVQDVFIKVMLNIKQYRGENFSGWIYTIARNVLFMSKRNKHYYYLIEDVNIPDSENIPEILDEKNHYFKTLVAVDSLADDEKLLISLRLKNMKLSKISKITGLTYKSVSNKIKIVVDKIHKSVLVNS